MKTRSIKYNFIQNFIYNIAMYLFPLVTYPYVTRVLTPEEIGKVTFAQSFSTYFSILAICGITTYATRKVAVLRDRPNELRGFVKEILALETVLSFIVFLVYVGVVLFVPYLRDRKFELILMSVNIFTGGISSLWLYNGLEQFGSITKRFLICKTFTVILFFVTVRKSGDYLWYAAFTFLADALVNLIGLLLIPKYVRLSGVRIRIRNVFRHVKGAIVFLASTMANCIYTNLDSVMLTLLTNDKQTGFYSSALKIRTLLIAVVLALARVLMPRLAYSLRDGKVEEVNYTVRKVLHITLLLAVYLSVFTVFNAEKIIVIFAGHAYSYASSTLIWAVMSVPVFSVSAIFTEQLFIAQNKEKYVTKVIMIGAVADILLNYVLMPSYGSAGGAAATFLTEMLILILCLLKNGENNKIYLKRKVLFETIFLVALESVILFGMSNVFSNEILTLFFSGAIYTIIFILALLIFKDEELQSLLVIIRKKINKN